MPIKTTREDFLNKHASAVIANLPNKFDSHDFIQALIKEDEKGYVEQLYECIDSKNGIFRTLHSQIGLYLSRNRIVLNINSQGTIPSDNIKDYESLNEEWIKNHDF